MRLPERFCITIEGDRRRVMRRAIIVPKHLPYLLGRLLDGSVVAEDAFAAFGLRVTVEECCDQGDDGEAPAMRGGLDL